MMARRSSSDKTKKILKVAAILVGVIVAIGAAMKFKAMNDAEEQEQSS